jgi:hypothetical protein
MYLTVTVKNNVFKNIPLLQFSNLFRPIIRENIWCYCIKQVYDNTRSVLYVGLPVIVIIMMGRKGPKHEEL